MIPREERAEIKGIRRRSHRCPVGRVIYFVLWHVPAGHRPSVQEAIERLEHLKAHGPSERAFGWQDVASAKLWKSARCA